MAKLSITRARSLTGPVTVNVFIRSALSGEGLTGLTFDSAGLTAFYALPRQAALQIPLAELADVTAAYVAGGFIEVDATNMPGWYRFDLPDAALGSDWNAVTECSSSIQLQGAADMEQTPIEFALTATDQQDSFNASMTSIDVPVSSRLSSQVYFDQVPPWTADLIELVAQRTLLQNWTDFAAEDVPLFCVFNAMRALRNRVTVNAGVLTVYKEDGTTVAYTCNLTQQAGAAPIIAQTPVV